MERGGGERAKRKRERDRGRRERERQRDGRERESGGDDLFLTPSQSEREDCHVKTSYQET